MSDIINHAAIKRLAEELRRPMYTLAVLDQDPFTADAPARRAAAEWFVKLWTKLNIQPGAHLHRIHYIAVSQKKPVLLPNGRHFENTRSSEKVLMQAALDARYLRLISPSDLVDRRNDEPIINRNNDEDADPGIIFPYSSQLSYEPPPFDIPRLIINPPHTPQRYHLEIWIEKSTMDDVLLPLGERYGINLVRGVGEMSHTRCNQLVERALASNKPLRLLYGSDFDPAGGSMPVAVARKIEFLLRAAGFDLDIQVRPIVLTHEQCIEYQLPRTPIKDSEQRAASFEARFGEGATELDALEALHPGELERIIMREVGRYYDHDLDERVDEMAGDVSAELNTINTRVTRKHAKAIAGLEGEREKVLKAITAFQRKAAPVLRKITQDLEAEAPDIDDYEWPEPDEGDEDPDPLFDSTRDYVEQIDRFKGHQGKPTERTSIITFRKLVPAICTN